MPNKIAAITMVKNEADIIESFVRHTLKFADVLLVTDHQSTDETPLILQKLIDEGLPLYVNTFTKAGKFQSEVMTGLMYRAFDEYGADLAVALDADEFLLHGTGDSEDLRAVLQSAATNEVYYIEWINYELAEPEINGGKYLLGRPCRRSKEASPLQKVIVGREAALRDKLILGQGNHHAITKGTAENWLFSVKKDYLPNIHLAHFQWRSAAQQAAKNICNYLGNLARFSEYTIYAGSYKKYFEDYIAGERPPTEQIEASVAADLSHYENECELCYTTGNIDVTADVMRLAEIFAKKAATDTVLLRQRKVTLILIYDGDTEGFNSSLQSMVKEPYPYKEFFVLAKNDTNFDEMLNLCQKTGERITVVAWKNIAALPQKVGGEYVKEESDN